MDKDNLIAGGVSVLFGLLLVLLFVVTFFTTNALNKASCEASWPLSFQPKYSFMTKCTIVVKGVRIPTKNYRTY